ncbi:MAG: L-serine ammonia-lyase, iron-sulfur-dependent, subunit alpha [Synergistaceae bacterium]|jgi:L-cysteine desulfidase|nr:L-serine ammonia-lyase, iron-sulfur-dependent, subunit alpha [Synergistaceae bacterium]
MSGAAKDEEAEGANGGLRAEAYLALLNDELILSEGCTEPIAIAYAASVARRALGEEPERIEVRCSRNVLKNAKSVVVPNLGGLKGILAAAVAGAIGGDPDKHLEVMSGFDQGLVPRVRELAEKGYCSVALAESDDNLYIKAIAHGAACAWASAEIKGKHDNVISIEKNGEAIMSGGGAGKTAPGGRVGTPLDLRGIYDFATSVDLGLVAGLLDRQIKNNIAICEEGLSNRYGAEIGRTLLNCPPDSENVERLAAAYAAAGSDARMSGCSMAVVINSGSGNQGITVTAPVWVYARYLKSPREELYRALCMSNLVAIHIKSMVGRLSAYCGVVCAACGSSAGITYLSGGNFERTANAVSNALAYISGIMCDGAKPSCAAKIASSVQAAILGHRMAMRGVNFQPGDGVTGEDPETTLRNIGYIASEGLAKADDFILDIMLGKPPPARS